MTTKKTIDPEAEAPSAVMLATQGGDLGLVPADRAHAEAQSIAEAEGEAVTIRHPETDAVLATVKPAKKAKAAAKARSNAKTPAKGVARAARKAAADASKAGVAKVKAERRAAKPAAKQKASKRAPSGKVAQIIKLACRAKGVSAAELDELTQWRGAAWGWLFKNRTGNGFSQKWGYTLKVEKPENGARSKTRYYLSPKAGDR